MGLNSAGSSENVVDFYVSQKDKARNLVRAASYEYGNFEQKLFRVEYDNFNKIRV